LRCAPEASPKGVNHGEDKEAEGNGDAGVSDGAGGYIIDDDRPSARENEEESAEEFCQVAVHDCDG